MKSNSEFMIDKIGGRRVMSIPSPCGSLRGGYSGTPPPWDAITLSRSGTWSPAEAEALAATSDTRDHVPHFLVGRAGAVIQLLPLDQGARLRGVWHLPSADDAAKIVDGGTLRSLKRHTEAATRRAVAHRAKSGGIVGAGEYSGQHHEAVSEAQAVSVAALVRVIVSRLSPVYLTTDHDGGGIRSRGLGPAFDDLRVRLAAILPWLHRDDSGSWEAAP